MKTLLLYTVLMSSILLSAHADNSCRISHFEKLEVIPQVYLDNKWYAYLPGFCVGLMPSSDTPANKIYVHAYFFDRDGKQIKKYDYPPQAEHMPSQSIDDITWVSLPKVLKGGQSTNVYYPITKDLHAKWKTFLVVFGNESGVDAKCFPSDHMKDLEFPEKDEAIKNQPDGF